MADIASLIIELGKVAWKIVKTCLEHESTAQNLKEMEKELRPKFAEIEEMARKMNLPKQEIESLEMKMREMREARLKYSEIESWNCCMAPCYKEELEKAEKSIKDFISYRLMVQSASSVMQIQCHLQIGTRSVHQATHHILEPTLKIDNETLMFPEFVEGLNSPLMEILKCGIMKDDDGDEVLNLNGITGTGKTTLAIQLCLDQQVLGWFKGNVFLKSLRSNIMENNNGEQLGIELREKWNNKKGLLVVDDVEPGSQHLFEQCLRQLPSNSKILVISRVSIPGLGRPVAMTPLGEQDAIILLSHYVRPIGAASCNLPNRHIVLKVIECCGGSPMAIKMIGLDLRGKQNDFWEQYLRDWSRYGHSIILDTHSKLLNHIHNSLKDLEEYEAISEFFMDLALFPKHEIIPISALLDMWVELYDQDEEGIDAMTVVHRLGAMNLAHTIVPTGDNEENDVDNQFLTQHNILRELANRYTREQAGEFERKRLIIEINGIDTHRQCLRQQPQRGINAFLPLFNSSNQRAVAARILSITTDQNVTPDSCYILAAEAQVLVLNLRTHEYALPEFIKEMKNLKVLIVTNYGSRSTTLFQNFKLIGFLKTLRRMRLEHVTVACICKLKNLRKLSLYKCDVKTAFENSSMKFSKAMPNLVELKIDNSTDFVEMPVGLCNIINLKKLSISKCPNFTTLPQEIRKLKNLELLRIYYCAVFEEMPESISELQSLTFLDISHCRTLKKLPDNTGELKKLTNLYMSDCPKIDELPDSIMNLTGLKKVICDDHMSHEWEVVMSSLGFHLEVKTVSGMP